MTDLDLATEYDPFAGDFGDPGDRTLRDKIVRFRTARPCHCCGQDVKPGTSGRSLTMLWAADGVMSYAYCADCTEAQAKSWDDEREGSGCPVCPTLPIRIAGSCVGPAGVRLMSIAKTTVEYGRQVWSPGPRLRSLGFREVDLGGEDDPLGNYRATNLNRDAKAALKRDRDRHGAND